MSDVWTWGMSNDAAATVPVPGSSNDRAGCPPYRPDMHSISSYGLQQLCLSLQHDSDMAGSASCTVDVHAYVYMRDHPRSLTASGGRPGVTTLQPHAECF